MKTPFSLVLCLLLAGSVLAEDPIVVGGLDGLDPAVDRPQYRVVLALSGGGIRGLASIGVLQAFEEKGIEIEGIAGASMGGIVGGLYAAGYDAAELKSITRDLDFAALFQNAPPRSTMLQTRRRERGRDLLTIRFDGLRPRIPQAITSAQYLTNFLTMLTARATYQASGDFTRLQIPYAVVCTDVISGERVVLRDGSLADAMRATMAFPLAFTGHDINGRLLMDGGMVDPLPVSLARELGGPHELVVAVNTASPLMSREDLITPIDIADQVTTIMTAERLTQSLREADFVITPALSDVRSTDYRYRDSLIELGYQAGLQAADSIIGMLNRREDSTCVSLVEVTCDSVVASYHALLQERLLRESCTRRQIAGSLREVLADTSLFRLEAALVPAGDSIDSRLSRLHVSGYRCFSPGNVTFRFIGNTRFDDTTLHRALALSDSVVTPARLRRGLERIRDTYRTRGWDLAFVRQVVIEPERRMITLVVDEAIVHGIEVDGEKRTRPWYIRAHFPLKTGQPYSMRQAAAGLKNIYGTDLFDRVTVDIEPNEGRPTVHIRVEEKAYNQVRLGWHWDDEYESEEFAEVLDDNIAGIGLEGIVHARYSPDRQEYHLGFKADRIFKTYLTGRVRAYHTVLDRHLYNDEDSLVGQRKERVTGAEVRLGQQIARLGTVSAAIVTEEVEYTHEGDPEVKENFGLRALELESLVETFDRVPFPQTGKKHYFALQLAGQLFGGDIEYTRFFTSIEAYFPMGEYLTYHPKIALGLSAPDLPWSEKFYLGGMDSFAGYRTHQLSGDKMLLVSNEVRLRLPLRLYLSTRYDIGNAFDSADEFKFATLRHGAGVFLSLDTPVGPFEMGYGVNDDTDRFYLRAGFDF